MKKIAAKRLGILSTSTIVVVVAMFLYYFYTDRVKETRVKKEAFKIMYRKAQNLKDLEKGLVISYASKPFQDYVKESVIDGLWDSESYWRRLYVLEDQLDTNPFLLNLIDLRDFDSKSQKFLRYDTKAYLAFNDMDDTELEKKDSIKNSNSKAYYKFLDTLTTRYKCTEEDLDYYLLLKEVMGSCEASDTAELRINLGKDGFEKEDIDVFYSTIITDPGGKLLEENTGSIRPELDRDLTTYSELYEKYYESSLRVGEYLNKIDRSYSAILFKLLLGDTPLEIFPILVRKEKLFDKGRFKSRLFSDFLVFDESTLIHSTNSILELELKQGKLKGFHLDSLKYVYADADKKQTYLTEMLSIGERKLSNPDEKQLEIEVQGEKYQAFIVPVQGVKLKYLVGLIPNSKFSAYTRPVDRRLVSWTLIFIVFFMLSLPFLRLLFVSQGENFRIRNLMSLVVCSALLFFFIAYGSIYYASQYGIRKNIDVRLVDLSDTIKNSLKAELDSMQENLVNFAQTNYPKKEDLNSMAQLGASRELDNLIYIKLNIARDAVDAIFDSFDSKYPYWKNAFIVDRRLGDSKNQIIFDTRNPKRYREKERIWGADLSKRNYVTDPELYLRNGKSIGFESVNSLTTLKPEGVLSMPYLQDTIVDDKGDTTLIENFVICLASDLYSVNNTILPEGYSFCVVDNQGEVWFHHESENNKRENLLQEIDEDPSLQIALKERRAKKFDCMYKLRPTRMYVQPILPEFGLTLVCMHTKNETQQVVNQASYILMATFLSLMSMWLIVACCYRWYARVKLKSEYQSDLLLDFYPNPLKQQKYSRLILYNGLMSVFVLLSIVLFYREIYIYHWIRILLFVGIFILFWNAKILRIKEQMNWNTFVARKSITILVLAIICTFLFEKIVGQMPLHDYQALFFNHSFNKSTFLIALLSVVSVFVLYRRIPTEPQTSDLTVSTKFKELFINAYKKNIYSFYVGSLILGVVFVPLWVLYIDVFYHETTLYRNDQLRYVADRYMEKYNVLEEDFPKHDVLAELKNKGNYFGSLHDMAISSCSNDSCTVFPFSLNDNKDSLEIKDLCVTDYLQTFGPTRSAIFYLNNLLEDRGNMAKASYYESTDRIYHHYSLGKSLLLTVNKGGGTYQYPESLSISLDRSNLIVMPVRYWGFLIGLFFVFTLFAATFPIIGRYIFPYYRFKEDPMKKFKSLPPRGTHNVYCVSVEPTAAQYEPADKLIRIGQKADYQEAKDELRRVCKRHIIITLDHFNFKNVIELEDFVELLEMAVTEKSNIQLESCYKPSILKQQIKVSLERKIDKNHETQIQLDALMSRLSNALSHFQVQFIPIKINNLKEEVLTEELKNAAFKGNYYREHVANCIGMFANSSFYLNVNGEGGIKKLLPLDDFVAKCYQLNNTYYQKLWEGFTPEEKSLLFDIAEDHIINMHKDEVTEVLIKKGVVRHGQYLELFNLSFTHFVRMREREVFEINQELLENSRISWSMYSLPIKILIGAVLVFLVIINQEFLTKVQSILLAVSGILGIGLRFFSFSPKSFLGKSDG
ncbi:hypothetical protein [Mangrovibacterium diazotrophicum]|uniref:Cache domain-containing protein n=1 Tax=Mangrovibacterium diazotrophicum TaxID=1261403 RepID=A0A419W3E1_9BACT|nr:hypothetical protein [Mangrovibacterium diazotrophicum]RKD89995.1 hypothetical protein BC643_0329 [Mangrovibacterium diazotrophicum]